MKHLILFSLMSWGLLVPTTAQNWTFATDSLVTNQIKAYVRSDGALFYDGGNNGLFVGNDSVGLATGAGIWLGGKDAAGQLRSSFHAWNVWQLGNPDFWPGPLANGTAATDSATTATYNQVWKLSRAEWEAYQLDFGDNGIIDQPGAYPNVYNWPAFLTDLNGNQLPEGAPWVDVDGDPLVYNPNQGDHPEMHGDQMLWWVFNDVGPGEPRFSGASMGMEIHALVYAYDCTDGPYMSEQLLVSYELINRSAQIYQDLYLGQWLDFDIGSFQQNQAGIDTLNGFFYGFYGDSTGFGQGFPSIGVQQLGDSLPSFRFDHFMTYANNFVHSPTTPADHYGFLQSYFPGGKHLVDNYTNGGSGWGHPDSSLGPQANFQYPGSVCDGVGWTMNNAGIPSNDLRAVGSVGPLTSGPNQIIHSHLAYVYSSHQGTPQSVCSLEVKAAAVRDWYQRPTTSCLIPGLVFPGDHNHDQVADMWDLLPVGVHFGTLGPARPSASLSWWGQLATDWGDTLQNGVDIKHVDSDGNGIITYGDTLAIQQNYGLTHTSFKSSGFQSGGAELYLTYSDSLLDPGDTLAVTAWLGTIDTFAQNAYGIAFQLQYDTSKVKSVNIDQNISWLGTTNVDMIAMSRHDSLLGNIDLGQVRIDQMSQNGYGKLGQIIIVMDDDIAKRNLPFSLEITRARLVDAAGAPQALSVIQSNVEIQTGIEERWVAGLNIYPNPVRSVLHINWEKPLPTALTLLDVQGKKVWEKQLFGQQESQLSVAELPVGIYFLQVRQNGSIQTQKVWVQH